MSQGRVARLPEDLVNKIAAGEVVERPASVVKELVENALDAGASRVTVDIEGGGKRLVRVRDDGSGMSRADAELALERHATSKLRTVDDLQAIGTHGFRGEALPSIASVSQLLLRTRDESPAGTEIEVRHGRLVQVKDVGHPRGTTVEVSDLFGAVPARRKFLRAEATEASHVAEAVTLLALARPQTGFLLTSGGRSLVQAPAAADLRSRAYQLLGGSVLEELVPIEGELEWARVGGLAARTDAAAGRLSLRLFVNGRAVRDRMLARAVTEAYRNAGAREARGEVILFLETPLGLVDVNVHPAKTEVRFADGRLVWAAVEKAVREGLSAGARQRTRGEAPPVPARAAAVESAVERFLDRAAASRPAADGSSVVAESPAFPPPTSLAPAEAPTVLGQHRNTYIVASDGDELILVDQHTAHERVRFEALRAAAQGRGVESQLLLLPIVASLPPELRPLLEEHAERLPRLGFDVEPFGGGSASIRAVPAVLAGDPGMRLLAILRDLREREAGDWAVAGADDRVIATVACHSAARAGEPLARPAMEAILRGLWSAEHPSLCPHGRPTTVRIPKDDVSRWFGRSGWRRT